MSGLAASTDGLTQGQGSATLRGSWQASGLPDECSMGGSCCDNCFVCFRWFYGSLDNGFNETDHFSSFGECSQFGTLTQTIGLSFDRVFEFRMRAVNDFCSPGGVAMGDVISAKSHAETPTAGPPAVSAVTASSATVDCTFDAKVVESTYTVFIQYRQFGSSTWITAGAGQSTPSPISRGLTGLTGGTTYEVRFHGTRETENIQTWDSSTVTFTTSASAPTITTSPASSVSDISAMINGVVDPNGLNVRVRFGWGVSDGGSNPLSWSVLTNYQSFSGDGDQTFQEFLTLLTPNLDYFYRAFVEWPSPGFGSSSSGVTESFTTPLPPGVVAAQEDHMHIYEYEERYGVQNTFFFTLQSPSATSSDRLVTTAPGSLFAAGDIKISKDGGAFANVTNSVVQVAASNPLYSLTLTAAEMQATQIVIQIVDQNGPAFRDAFIFIKTRFRIGQIDVQGDQIGSSANAVQLRPSSGGAAFKALDSAGSNIGEISGFLSSMACRVGTLQAGGAGTATLDASASASNDYYNGDILMLVGGTGAGQSRVISDYVGATKVASLISGWSVNPDSTTRYVIIPGARALDVLIPELAAIPSAGASAAEKIQFCFQRFAFKVTQTATLQTLFNSTGSSLGTRSVSDDGTTQTIEKVV